MITLEHIEKLMLEGEMFQAVREYRELNDCLLKDAIYFVNEWKKDRAERIGR